MPFIAYLLDSDTVAFGLGHVGLGNTKKEALKRLKDKENASRGEKWDWKNDVEQGDKVLSWGTNKARLFITEIR